MRPLPASTAAASNLALPYMQTIHKHVTSLVRTRQCVNVLDHDVYVDCDGDLDLLLGSKGSANRVLCSTWAMSPSWRASGYCGSASTYSITVADEDSDGDVDVLLGSSWQLVGSDKPSAAQRGGRHLLDKHPDINSDIAQRANVLDRGGRRVDGDGTATLKCCLGAMARWLC